MLRRSLYSWCIVAGSVLFLILWCSSWIREDSIWASISRLGQPQDPVSEASELAPSRTPSEAVPLPTVLDVPSDYLHTTDDQRVCEQVYGTSYLKYIATHQQQYCEPESLGALQCFSAPRHPAPWASDWKNDTLCIAQGVLYTAPGLPPADGTDQVRFTTQCRARNFTLEAQTSETAAKELAGYPDLNDMPTYWFDTGIGPTLRSWHVDERSEKAGCTRANANSEWVLLARREDNDNIWHKMAEIWQARHTVDALRMAIDPATGKPWLTAEQAANITVVFDDDRAEPLDHLWTIATGNTPVRMSAIAPGTCFGNVIIPLAGSSSPFWTALLEGVYHEPCRAPVLLDTWVRRVLDFMEVTPRPASDVNAHPTITIIERASTRKILGLTGWVDTLRSRYPESKISVVDFASISLREQLRIGQETDVLVGHHGAGMTHSIFLPPEAAVVEILPPVFGSRGFRSLARMRGLAHFAVNCMWPEEWNNTVNGVPLPEGWTAPKTPVGWQEAELTYLTEDVFLGVVDAAVRNQMSRRFQYAECAPDC